MSKETFDFSEALRRMREGKKVRRKARPLFLYEFNGRLYVKNYCIRNGEVYYSEDVYSFDCEDASATDWEEVEG